MALQISSFSLDIYQRLLKNILERGVFEEVFSEQLKNFAKETDVLIAISSSGKSANIIKAVKTAKKLHLPVIGLVGFDGGELLALADAKIYVPSQKYAIVESAHEAICHLITTYFEESIK